VNHATVSDGPFIIGVNGSNAERIRKVVFAGRVCEVMTFAVAHRRLSGERFRELREHRSSPLHVRPIVKDENLVGYEHEHVSDLHIEGWVEDLVSDLKNGRVRPEGRQLLLHHGTTAWQAFDRDCCMLLENRFFAQGQGIEFDEQALKILREAQQEEKEIDDYAIFGRTKKQEAKGLRGTYLEITGGLADEFMKWLDECAAEAGQQQRGGAGRVKGKCHFPCKHGREKDSTPPMVRRQTVCGAGTRVRGC
jgi:hypothetical protein